MVKLDSVARCRVTSRISKFVVWISELSWSLLQAGPSFPVVSPSLVGGAGGREEERLTKCPRSILAQGAAQLASSRGRTEGRRAHPHVLPEGPGIWAHQELQAWSPVGLSRRPSGRPGRSSEGNRPLPSEGSMEDRSISKLSQVAVGQGTPSVPAAWSFPQEGSQPGSWLPPAPV